MPRATSRRAALFRICESTQLPIYVLDRRFRIRYANQALADFVGLPLDQLIGITCRGTDAATTGVVDLRDLSPPANATAQEMVENRLYRVSGGKAREFPARFLRLDDTVQSIQGWLVIVGHHAAEVTPTRHSEPRIQMETSQLKDELVRLRGSFRQQYRLDALIGKSAAINRVHQQIRLAASGSASVVVHGPPGSGREAVARTIHNLSDRDQLSALVPLAANVLEAELLRTTIEAFLKRCAELETAHTPTLLLLDVDHLAGDAQLELFGFLSVSEFGLRAISTAQDLPSDLARNGHFLTPLAEALSTLQISLPPLTERLEDIPLLAQHFVECHNRSHERQLDGFTSDALDRLLAFPWSRHVEELKQAVAESCHAADGPQIGDSDLPARIRLGLDAMLNPAEEPTKVDLAQHLNEVEWSLIQSALRHTRGNKSKAAQLLSISRGRLLRRIEQLAGTPGTENSEVGSDDEAESFSD